MDNITLKSDMNYTIQVSFSNLDGQFKHLLCSQMLNSIGMITIHHRLYIYNNYKNIFQRNERTCRDIKTEKAQKQD